MVYADNDIDYASLVVDVPSSRPLVPADSDQIKEGEAVIAIGHPYGHDFTVSKGIVSCKNRVVKGIRYIQTDVPINPGNSGGPLINSRGEVIGINSWVVGEADNMSFAVPINSIKQDLAGALQVRDRLLTMYYCPICGYLCAEFQKTKKGEYCPNCGTRRWEKKKPEPAAEAQPSAAAVKVGMIMCPKCRTANETGSNFCQNCGVKIS